MSNEFIEALSSSVRDVELPTSPFSPRVPGVENARTEVGGAGGTKILYRVRRDVFVIFFPPGKCSGCRYGKKNGGDDPLEGDDPTEAEMGEVACTHTRLAEYEATVNRGLAGEVLLGPETEYVQKDGTVMISLKWFEPQKIKKKRGDSLPEQE